MNRNMIFLVLGGIGALGIAGAVTLQIVRPDATATLTDHVFGLLQFLLVAGGVVYGFSKQEQKLQTIERNTNGALHSREQLAADLRNELAAAREQLAAERAEVPPPTLTESNPIIYQPEHASEDGESMSP